MLSYCCLIEYLCPADGMSLVIIIECAANNRKTDSQFIANGSSIQYH